MSHWNEARLQMNDRFPCRSYHRGGGKWTLKEEDPKYAPDRTCDVEHLRLEIAVDLPRKHLDAVCTQRLRAAYGPFDSITLDAVDLRIRWIRDGGGRELDYTYLDRKLAVRFPKKIRDTVDLVISYEVDDPVLGLYFVGPSEIEPKATWQLWSQGEDEEARYWIPCHDAPNERMTTEMIVKVDSRYTVVSNGALKGVAEKGGKRTYHWLESVPHVSYLITLVVGEFVRIADEWKGIPVDYYVEPHRKNEARRSFGKTPKMIDFFSRVLEFPYPYEKYSQIAIRHFHFGGMENTSATSQTDGTLHDARAHIDFSSDDLVSHELAHQWFGDLLTCKSWAHAWLNEGFATYFEALWKEEDLGRDEFDYEMHMNAAAYMAEPYRRAIVSNRYAYPQDLFDMHLYPKGAWVLHMLRRKLGDELFWKALRLYVRRHAQGCVETIDLIRAFEDASGRNLTEFFDQWIMSPGHAEIEGSISWEEKEKRVKVALKQTQKSEGGTPVYKLPIRIECAMEGTRRIGASFEMDRAVQTFYASLPGKPRFVTIDPEGAILATWKLQQPKEWIGASLTGKGRETSVYSRVVAVRQLADKPAHKEVALLGRVLADDSFWGVQAEAARVLGTVRSPQAEATLIAATSVKHPKARRSVVAALGNYRSASASQALRKIVRKGDPSYFVEAAAAVSLGLTRQEKVAGDLRAAIRRPSWHDTVMGGAASGLAAARDESAVPDLAAVAADRSRYWSCRLAALRALADLGAARPALAPAIAETMIPFLQDPDRLVSSRVADAIVALGHESGVGALRRAAGSTPDPRQANAYLMAADELAAQRKRGEDVDRLRSELDQLRGEAKEMKEALRRLEEKPARKAPRRRSR